MYGNFKTYPHDPRIEVSDQGWVKNVRTGRVTKGHSKHDGYLYYLVGGRGGVCRPVHNLVLETFVGDCPEGYQCHHINSKTSDNRLVNLKWVTVAEHAIEYQHLKALGTPVCVFFDNGVLRGTYNSISAAARVLGVHHETVRRAANGITKMKGYRIQFI